MSTLLEASGGGLDWNSLTSGEQLLIGWLAESPAFRKRTIPPGGYNSADQYGMDPDDSSSSTLDFSNVQSLVWNIRQFAGGNNISIVMRLRRNNPSIQVLDYTLWSSGDSTHDVTCNIDDTYRTNIMLMLIWTTGTATDPVTITSYFTLKSFTTIDGRVHTASNLNY